MSKYEILLRAMRTFRSLLADEATRDPEIQKLLVCTSPLFDAIEAKEIVPPREGLFASPFQGEYSKYGFPHPLYSAASEFICALEDWPSKPWWPGPRDYGAVV